MANRGGKVETAPYFIFLGSKITVDSDCNQEIKRHLLLGRKAMTNLERKKVKSLSCVWLFATPWTVAQRQASLSPTVSQSLLKFMSIESVMLSNYLIFCHLLPFCLQSFPASRTFPMSCLFTSGGQSIGVYEFRIGYANTRNVKFLLIR